MKIVSECAWRTRFSDVFGAKNVGRRLCFGLEFGQNINFLNQNKDFIIKRSLFLSEFFFIFQILFSIISAYQYFFRIRAKIIKFCIK